jgi:Holliday junction resolvase
MAQESNFQRKVVGWLRQKGCYVLTVSTVRGIPDGCPDIIALIDGGGWLALECKTSQKSKFQPLQKVTIQKLNNMFYSRPIWPSIWDEVKKELEKII